MNLFRLPTVPGEWIDRTQLVTFTFEGKTFYGYTGDTISSALLAAGQRVLGRSFKYHRPRSVLSFANHDINTLMQAGQEFNIRADVTPVRSGLALQAVNTFGGVGSDRASVLNFFSPFLPVGFYYKVFHNKKLFPYWEKLIRQIGGLGHIDPETPHIRTPKRYDFCDVLVIGAGVSGLSAALAAAEQGADVVIIDENTNLGGSGSYQRGGDLSQFERTTALIEAVRSHPQIRLYTNTVAAGYYADHWIPLVHENFISKMRSKSVIVATGAYEQPAVFHNNDLPGIMLASAAQRLLYRYAVKPMQRAIVLTANADGYRAALDLVANGITVVAIVDLRSTVPHNSFINKLRSHNIPIYPNHYIYEARSTPAQDTVSSVVLSPRSRTPDPHSRSAPQEPPIPLSCDGILMSVGWCPAANLLYQAGSKLEFSDRLQQFIPTVLPDGIYACGRVNGVYDFEQKMLDGKRSGLEAAAYLGLGEKPEIAIAPEVECPSHPYPIADHPNGKNFVDFDEDLQLKDFFNAAQEGFDNIELLKRYTTVGMGASQGKHSNMNAIRILARIKNTTPGQVGTTTARPFFHPVPLSHLAGRGFTPERETPLHSRHVALTAKLMRVGQWQRPEYYQQVGKSREQCIADEVEAVRTGVGVMDVGTLGKLEIYGSDATEFLERVYAGRYAKLKPGMTRYALMLDESGVVIDDGVIARLGHDRFYFTTTTSGSTAIYRELSRLNTRWKLDCRLVNVTGARSAINLAGQYSRKILSQLTDLDLSAAAFPYLAVRETTVANIPAILMRVGFVGEWGYEIHVPAEYAPALWDVLMKAGKPYNIKPFGVEAQRLLRLEKGHIIVGQDTDGLTTPIEANLEWAVKLDKPFFIGQRSLQVMQKRLVKQKLVGFRLDRTSYNSPPQECNLVIDQNEIAGRITSVAYSSTLKHYIGLAYVKPELQVGDRFSIRLSDGSLITAQVSKTPFYDPENLRQQETSLQRQEALV